MMEEIWKDIAGYEGKYQVSNMGRVRSLPRVALDTKGRRQQVKGIILKPNDRKGYDSVRLRDNGRYDVFSVHRLVGMAFVPGYFDGAVINHKDENPKNNRADNLEWVSLHDNILHGFENGLYSNQIACTLVSETGIAQQFRSCSQASLFLGRNPGYINLCIRKARKARDTQGHFYKIVSA